ncbi:MAG: cyclase [Verrucomicrobia bacterium]|nr:MAG: cyclase [Verrucomicrobiota bacterium]
MKPRFQDKATRKRNTARITQQKFKGGKGLQIEKAVTINRSPMDLYSFWRQFEKLPMFMTHLRTVTEREDGTSHWVMETDKGKTLEWHARLIEDRPGEMLSWQSLENADVDNAGSVWFMPAAGGRGTMVRLKVRYNPPGGKLGAAWAKITGQSAEKQIADELHRFKALMETGEIPTSEGQPKGGKD